MSWPWNPCQRSLKVIGTDTDRSATYKFLLKLYSTHMPISYRFRDKRRFNTKIKNFSHPCVFDAPCWRSSPGIEYRHSGSENPRIMGLPGRERSLTISSAVWIQYTNVMDGRTDRRTRCDSKDRAYALRRAGKTRTRLSKFGCYTAMVQFVQIPRALNLEPSSRSAPS